MKHKNDIKQYIEKPDVEFKSDVDFLTTHLWLIAMELISIIQALRIEATLEKYYKSKIFSNNRFGYSPVRAVLHESIPYRIIMGLSKIFTGTKEYSLEKTINKMSQIPEIYQNPDIMKVIKDINSFINSSKTVEAVTTLRDGFYAHLDKETVFADCRIDVSTPLKHIDSEELNNLLVDIKKLHDSSCNDSLPIDIDEIKQEEVLKAFLYI